MTLQDPTVPRTAQQSQEFKLIIGGKPPDRAERAWFGLYVRSEFKVEESLREIGFDAYCPTETKWHRQRRIRRVVRWPLLPGYVFTELEATQHGVGGAEFPFAAVEAIEGVVDFLRASGKPAKLRYDPLNTPQEGRAFTIGEIRELENTGAFDQTQDRIVAEKARKLVRRVFNSFGDLSIALAASDNTEPRDEGYHPFGPTYRVA